MRSRTAIEKDNVNLPHGVTFNVESGKIVTPHPSGLSSTRGSEWSRDVSFKPERLFRKLDKESNIINT